MADTRAYEAWHDPELVVSAADLASYEPLEVAKQRAEDVAYLLRFLVTGRDSENVDMKTAIALRLRKSYIKLVAAYRTHDEKYDRGWNVPDWRTPDDVPTLEGKQRAGVSSWTLDRWYRTEMPQIEYRAQLHAAALASRWDDRTFRRPERKTYNAIMALLGKELDYARWAFEIL